MVELLIVVAMIGVLSALAIVGYRKYVHAAQSSEAKSMIQAIRGAEEVYKSEMLQYLSVSTNLQTYYPTSGLSDTRSNWDNSSGPNYANWMMLNVHADSAVRFGYAVVAGVGGTLAAVDSSLGVTMPQVPNGVPWYVVQARNSHWADGSRTVIFASTSLGSEIMSSGDTAN